MEELRRLNFNKLISIGIPDVTTYSYDEYRNNGCKHTPINGYCISCENRGCNSSEDDDSYKLTNITHGTHSSDFFRAINMEQGTSNWHHEPIIFIYESPSRDYDIYKKVSYNGYKKCPSKDWYWIDRDPSFVTYPEKFKGREYGGFILSAILTFKLANVYVTNLVKCGLNDEKGDFKGLSDFKAETIENCFSNFLKKEISILRGRLKTPGAAPCVQKKA